MEKIKYMIMSHGRCGSMLCAFLLNEYIKSYINEDKYYVLNVETHLIEDYSNNDYVIYHAHNLSNLLTLPKDYNLIFPVRNIFNTIISKAVAVHTLKYKYFHKDLKQLEDIEPFSIDPKFFLELYNHNKQWHSDCDIIFSKHRKDLNPIKINYEDIENDPSKFFDIVGLDFNLTDRHMKNITVKVPYDYSKIITNYDDLKDYHLARIKLGV